MEEKFEVLIKELEEIVKKMESGTLSLEDSIAAYQRGMDLSAKCRQKLENAKEVVLKKMGEKPE